MNTTTPPNPVEHDHDDPDKSGPNDVVGEPVEPHSTAGHLDGAPPASIGPARAGPLAGALFFVGLALLAVALIVATGITAWLEAAGAIALLITAYALRFGVRRSTIYRPLQHRNRHNDDR